LLKPEAIFSALETKVEDNMKIAVVGAGALGLYYGALLQRGGQDVHFLLRRDYDAVTKRGLKIFSINGNFELSKVQTYQRTEGIGAVDLVLVGLKTFTNEMYAQLISPLIGQNTLVLTLQNGMGNEESLADLFGAERIIGGVAFLCSNRGEPGEVHHLGVGRITIGEYLSGNKIRLERLAATLNSCKIDCRTTDDLNKVRWEKLVWNIPFNGLCALLLQTVDHLLGVESTRILVREIMIEVISAANAQGLISPIQESFADDMLEITANMGSYMPSMQIDREQGRQLETEAIFRVPLKYGRKQGVAMPKVEMLVTLLEQAVLIAH
jgi:2-dehydropantoate 2-reductase